MAIIKFGVAVVGARGTAGGLTFSANKAGPYFKSWSKSANPRSPAQTLHRNKLADFAANWANLTDAQRDDWIDYADDPAQELTNSLGETYFASGFNWYVRINLNLQSAGAAQRVDAPTIARPAAPIFSSGTALRTTAGGGNTRAFFDVASPNLGFEHVLEARITSQGRTAIASGFKFQIVDVPNVSRVIVFQPEIEATFGTITLGQRMFINARTQNAHGRRSPLDSFLVDATA